MRVGRKITREAVIEGSHDVLAMQCIATALFSAKLRLLSNREASTIDASLQIFMLEVV